MAHTLDSISRVAFTQAALGHASLAAELLSASLALHEEAGLSVPLYQQRRRDEIMELLEEQLTPTDLAESLTRGAEHDLDHAVSLALEDGNPE